MKNVLMFNINNKIAFTIIYLQHLPINIYRHIMYAFAYTYNVHEHVVISTFPCIQYRLLLSMEMFRILTLALDNFKST